MTATLDLQTQLGSALAEVRRHRHQPDCNCRSYKGLYCTAEESLWSNSVDRLLDAIRRASF